MSRRMNSYVMVTGSRRQLSGHPNGQKLVWQQKWNSTVNVIVLMTIVVSIGCINLQGGGETSRTTTTTTTTTSPRKSSVQKGVTHFDDEQDSEISSPPRPKATRSSVTPTEFFGNSPPQHVLDDYFRFEPPHWELDEKQLRLRPTWQCSTPPPSKFDEQNNNTITTKVIVLQMFRSASSTLRAFFRAYSQFCGRSMALISQCVDLGFEFMQGDDIWRSGETSPRAATDCWLTSAISRKGDNLPSNPDGLKDRVNTAFFKEHDFDILAGSLPLGSHEFWLNDYNHNDVNIQHIVVLRQPLEKFVSQCYTLNQANYNNITVEQAVALVNQTAATRLANGEYFQSLSNYFITPRQIDWLHREFVDLTPQRRVNLTLSNMFHQHNNNNILVGLTDRWDETVQMLAFVLDGALELPNLMAYFSSIDKLKSSKGFTKMDNENRTKAVVAAILADDTISATMHEFLQYEQTAYDFARELHMKQYEWMLEDVKRMIIDSGNQGEAEQEAPTEIDESS